MRIREVIDCERYMETIKEKYNGEDVIFEGDAFLIGKLELEKNDRSEHGKCSNFLYDVAEYYGQNCYIPFFKIVF